MGVYLIGGEAAARPWLLRAVGPFTVLASADVGTPVVLASPSRSFVRGQVAEAGRLAGAGRAVWVVAGVTGGTSSATPWRLASWAPDRPGVLRLVPGQSSPQSTRPVANRRDADRDQPRALRRGAVAARLAGKGPTVAAYLERYWTAHHRAPTWSAIPVALGWPGDTVDHERALDALAAVGWIQVTSGVQRIARPGPRWTGAPGSASAAAAPSG